MIKNVELFKFHNSIKDDKYRLSEVCWGKRCDFTRSILPTQRRQELGVKMKKKMVAIPVELGASGIEPNAGVEPATLRLRVSRSTD
ncbi:hypothetical protein GGR57DRAFT_289390 [Xylariaceae sp. FL1272]|nr:hypothetical protein GGR57DRAFT_289390 [Xylariaceae sp. FL1272]